MRRVLQDPGNSGAAPATVGEAKRGTTPLCPGHGKAPRRRASSPLASPETGLRVFGIGIAKGGVTMLRLCFSIPYSRCGVAWSCVRAVPFPCDCQPGQPHPPRRAVDTATIGPCPRGDSGPRLFLVSVGQGGMRIDGPGALPRVDLHPTLKWTPGPSSPLPAPPRPSCVTASACSARRQL